jgi:hypothetical protein
VDYERKGRFVEGEGYQSSSKSAAAARTSQVDQYFNEPNGPSTDICHLMLLLFHIFGTLFSNELNGEKAGNCFTITGSC